MDAQGQVWWVNNNGNTLGRLSLGSDTGTTWNLPGAGNLLGLAIDQAGRIWVSDSTSSNLYSFDPASSSLCRRTLPDGGSSNYLAVHGSTLWLADWINGRIAGLDMTSNLLRYWTLPPKAFPVDLGADPGGNIWWADAGLGLLGRLEPGSGRLTHFPLPVGTQPGMLTVSPRMVWYTEERTATAGTLNPSIASSTSYMRTAVTSTLTPVCTPLVANGSAALLSHSAPIAWSPATITTTAPAAGWLIFQLPAGAQPRGIADAGDRVWVVEAGLKRLLSISIPRVYLPLVVRRS
jgi:streptogramin lyase